MDMTYTIGAVYKYVGRKEPMIFLGYNESFSHFVFEEVDGSTKYLYPRSKPHALVYKSIKQSIV
jgi:hypothetical protein